MTPQLQMSLIEIDQAINDFKLNKIDTFVMKNCQHSKLN